MKEAYLYDSGIKTLIFESAEDVAHQAVTCLNNKADIGKCRRELLTNVDGLRIREVNSFDVIPVSSFLSTMKAGGRLILSIYYVDTATTFTIKIEKITVIKKEEYNAEIYQ